ncbi:MAG: hypothetical protein K8R92_02765 [Planctomycetes bacterium]|nr:hypothetical protein [Planctomycetota bacterium]
MLLLCACQPYLLKSSAVDQFPGSQQEIEFLDVLEDMPAVTNNDALHSFLILQDGTDASKDYQDRVAEGIRRKWLSESFKGQANQAANVGWLAGAGCRIMKVRGGLTMMIFGPIDRYAVKELIYMEILPLRTDNQSLSGLEFIDYVNRLERIAGRAVPKKGELELDQKAGQTSVTPGNEAAIQEGSLPASGPLEAPNKPTTGSDTGTVPDPFPEPVNSTAPKPPQSKT